MDFSDYVLVLKRTIFCYISDEDIVNILFTSISDSAGIKSDNGEKYHVDKGTVSRLLSGTRSIPNDIIEGANRPKVRESMPLYFQQEIIPILGTDNLAYLREEFKQLIIDDPFLQQEKKVSLVNKLYLEGSESLAFCLARLFLLVIDSESRKKRSKNEINKYKRNPLPDVKIPDNLEQKESRYVSALFDVYSESEGKEIDSVEKLKTHNSSFKSHFDRQRRDFYNAECLRRNSRDVFISEEKNPFDVFVDDTYDGVIDTWEKNYSSGMERLTEVLGKATSLKHTRSLLASETQWIGPSQQKGVCHILVNDSKLDGWIKK